jgi:uncharacterized membrane protein YccC
MKMDRLLASDPALERLRVATRTSVSVLVASALLVPLVRNGIVPAQTAALGALVALWASVQANDLLPRDRFLTAALLAVPAMIGVTWSALFGMAGPVVGAAACALVIFPAIWVRRFGTRWSAFGMMTLLTAFFSLFVHIDAVELPGTYVAIALAIAVAWIVRVAIVRDSPGLVVRAAVVAFRAQARLLARRAAAVDSRGPRHKTERLRRGTVALNATALALDAPLASAAFRVTAQERLTARRALLESELDLERVLDGAIPPAHAPDRLDEVLHIADARRNRDVDAPLTAAPRAPDVGGIPATTRIALQITVAAIAAMILGALVPPHLFFWAVLTSFIVYSQTASAAEARNRSLARVAGTVLGVALGFALLEFVRGRHELELGLSVVVLFGTMYAFRASYFAFTVLLTALIAMVYDVVGRPTGELLEARLVETVIGGACAAIAASVVVPLDTRVVVSAIARAFVDRLRASIAISLSSLRGPSAGDAIDAARELDRGMQELLARIRPLASRWPSLRRTIAAETLSAIVDCGYRARRLADRACDAEGADRAEPAERVEANLAAALAALERTLGSGDGSPAIPHDAEPPEVIDALRRIVADLEELRDEGIALIAPREGDEAP